MNLSENPSILIHFYDLALKQNKERAAKIYCWSDKATQYQSLSISHTQKYQPFEWKDFINFKKRHRDIDASSYANLTTNDQKSSFEK